MSWTLCEWSHHLRVWADETGFLCAGGDRPYTVHRVRCGEAQGLAAAQGGGGQTPFAGSTAVVGNTERAALVIVQSTSCRGQHGTKNQGEVGRGGIFSEHCNPFLREICGPTLIHALARVLSYRHTWALVWPVRTASLHNGHRRQGPGMSARWARGAEFGNLQLWLPLECITEVECGHDGCWETIYCNWAVWRTIRWTRWNKDGKLYRLSSGLRRLIQ